jgi:hypothetical protein
VTLRPSASSDAFSSDGGEVVLLKPAVMEVPTKPIRTVEAEMNGVGVTVVRPTA